MTAEGTRARRSEAELLAAGPGHEVERQALEGLVRGRLVVANDAQDGAYELAHEALLSSWSTLQGWLQRGAADHVARARVEQAASVWQRMGRPRDLLWGRRQLAEVRSLDRKGTGNREVAFLAAAGRTIRRRRLVGAGAATVLVRTAACALTSMNRSASRLSISSSERSASPSAPAALCSRSSS